MNYWTIIGQSFLEGIDGNFENWKDNSQEKSEKYKKGKGIRNGAQGKEEKEMGFKKDMKIEKYERDRGRRGEEIRKEL